MQLCTIPLDTAKVRLQLQKKAVAGDALTLPKYKGMLGTVATIAREEGLASLWKGIVPGLSSSMPIWRPQNWDVRTCMFHIYFLCLTKLLMLFVLAELLVLTHDFVYQQVKAFYVGDNFVGDVPLSKKVLAALTTGENTW